MKPVTVCSVTFEDDYRLTVLQLLSIDRLANSDQIECFILVLNGARNDILEQAFKRVISSLRPAFAQKIRIIPIDHLGLGARVGFYDQQAIKLGISRVVKSEFYLVLDSKNHFIAPFEFDIFFDAGKPLLQLQPVSDYWRPYVQRSKRALDVTGEDAWDHTSNSVTPFIFKTDIAMQLCDYLVEKYDSDLPVALERTGGTEFILYHVFLKQNGLLNEYSLGAMPFRTLFTRWPQDPRIVKAFLSELSADVPVFGLHRKRLPQLNAEQKDLIGEVWHRDLLYPWENSMYFLDAPN